MINSVLLDTSFFVRLLNCNEILHKSAINYFQFFLENDIILKVSTISVAEYCVKGYFNDLPIKNLQIVPFNLDHAKRTAEFAKAIFEENKSALDKISPRLLIPNDSKLFAQADLEN